MRKYLSLVFITIFAWGCEKPAPQSAPQITSISVLSTADGDRYIEWEKDYYTQNFLPESQKEIWAQIEIRGVDLASDNYTSATEVKVVSLGNCSTYTQRTEDRIVCTTGGWEFNGPGKYYVVLRKGGEDGEWTAINEEHYIMVY